jgi:hypothetical protein
MTFQIALRPSHLPRKEVCWRNFLFADAHSQVEIMCSSFVGYLQARYEETKQDLTLQDLEQVFRRARLRTHLVADLPPPERECYDYRIFTTKEKIPRKYYCKFVCREKEAALQELLQTSSSYEENFAKLAESGAMMTSSAAEKLLDSEYPVNQSLGQMLMEGKHLIEVLPRK